MALRSKRPCKRAGCPELVDSGFCEDHTDDTKAHDKWRGTAASRVYDADWKRVRIQVLKRDKYLCLICLAAGRVTAALDVDHIIPISIAPERRLDKTNCQSLCRACHRAKTAAEQRISSFVLPGDGSPPAYPPTFVSLLAMSKGFNPLSADPAQRTQYWADSAGTISYGDVMVAMNGLASLQQAQIQTLSTSYQAALQVPIAYMGTTFEADASSQIVVAHSMLVYAVKGTTPPGFYFIDTNNNQVPMTLDQLQRLGSAIAASYWSVFQHWTALKAQVPAATTLAEVQAVVW